MLKLFAILVPLLPLLSVLVVAVGGEGSRRVRAKLGIVPIGASFCGALAVLYAVATEGSITILFYDPGTLASLTFPFGFHIDRLSSVMMALISAVGLIIYSYSVDYIFQDFHERRFLALIGLSTFVLLCMVSSANLLMLFIFWQLLSYLLYLLAHNHTHPGTLEGAFRTFTLLRVGDVAFLGGLALAFSLYGTLEIPELFARATATTSTVSLMPGVELNGATAVTLLLFIGGMSKSAQFPFFIWLPRSLYAPTPVHALLHAGIINAGGFLINRLAPLFALSPSTLHVVFVIGTATAILGTIMMLTQNDIKKTLGFSTIGQMGYMIMECGLGAFGLAVFHLVAHGIFKATVFLNCGNVIHKARLEASLPQRERLDGEDRYSRLPWLTGFVVTLVIPLIILLAMHHLLGIPLLESQGTLILLFFIWITSSQAMLTLTRLREMASWMVSVAMLVILPFVVFVYLYAVESFTAFLYPNPEEVSAYFQAASHPQLLFELIVVLFTIMTGVIWAYLYMRAHERSAKMPAWIETLRIHVYLFFMNRLYVEEMYNVANRIMMRLIHRFERRERGWSR